MEMRQVPKTGGAPADGGGVEEMLTKMGPGNSQKEPPSWGKVSESIGLCPSPVERVNGTKNQSTQGVKKESRQMSSSPEGVT